ncbi:MAG: 2Fe-2S iron-sulfur cluster-binding protein, partial [Aquirufa sp.]
FEANHKNEFVEEEEDSSLKEQNITLKYEGKEYSLLVKPHETILEAALNQDIDLPYSCQAGMCTACMGLCKSGTVTMDEEDGLTAGEIAKGYVLTCVAHPTSDGVVIDLD